MRRLPALLVIAAAVTSGWSTTDDAVVDDSLDSDSTVKTLAINEEDKYQKNLGQASKLDGQFLDDEAKEMNGNALSNEIQDALGSLGESKKLDEKAKNDKRRSKMFGGGFGAGGQLEESPVFADETPEKPHQAATIKGAFDDWKRTQKMYADDSFGAMDDGGAEEDLGFGTKPKPDHVAEER